MSDSPDDAEPASQEVIEAPEPGDRIARIEERHFEATFTSPLPPPQFLDAYEATLPGAADRILALTESEAEHRQQMVARLVDADAHRTRRGLLYVFVLASIIVVAVTSFAIVAVIVGHPVIGALVVILEICGVALSYLYAMAKSQKGDDTEEQVERVSDS